MDINRKFLKTLCITGCALFLIADPAIAAHCDKKPDHPHCKSGGGGGGISHGVDMTFRDSGLLGEAGADRIRSDVGVSGTVSYAHGEPGVSVRIRDDGQFFINITSTDRAVVLDFSDQSLPSECGAGCKKNFILASTDDFPPAAVGAIQVFGNGTSQHLPDQFFGMSVGETLLGEMKLGFGDTRKSTKFSVRFQALGDPDIDANVAAKSNFLEITRDSRDTWFIEAADTSTTGGDQALLFSKVKKKGKETVEDEGTYHMPFGLTVTCQSACPDRSGQ